MSVIETTTELSPLQIALVAVEVGLLLIGTFFLLRGLPALKARLKGRATSSLEPSPYNVTEMMLAAIFALGGGFFFQIAAAQIGQRAFPPPGDGSMGLFHVVTSGAFQLGLLAGIAHAWFWHLRKPAAATLHNTPPAPASEPKRLSAGHAALSGARVFVTLLPLVWLTSLAWQALLPLFGVEPEPQELVTLFANSGDVPALASMIVLAVVIAPLTEELLFRIGLFRWLRTRAPRAITLLVPALTFAALHGSVSVLLPLVVLALGLALAYERDGHPLTPIVTHAIFNLHTIVLLLAGFPS